MEEMKFLEELLVDDAEFKTVDTFFFETASTCALHVLSRFCCDWSFLFPWLRLHLEQCGVSKISSG